MLKIRLDNVGKRFNRGWVFREINDEIQPGESIAILGSNGSGKSTLLRIISGSSTPTKGEISYTMDGAEILGEQIYEHITIAAPYLELIEEYTLEEQVAFHFKFKKLIEGIEHSEIPALLNLEADKAKPIKQYSSGMIQRVKLGLAILSDTPLVLLDEPATNLDSNGIDWYNMMAGNYTKNRTVIICSNRREEEYHFCNRELVMENYR